MTEFFATTAEPTYRRCEPLSTEQFGKLGLKSTNLPPMASVLMGYLAGASEAVTSLKTFLTNDHISST